MAKKILHRLKTRQKSDRPPKLSKKIRYQIKKELKESNQGWLIHKTDRRINHKENRNKIPLHPHIPYSS
jgi:hypothetical protein